MTTFDQTSPVTTAPATLPPAAQRRSSAPGRIASLARSELTVLVRNSVAAFYAVAMAPLMVLLMTTLPFWDDIANTAGAAMAVRALGMLAVFGVVMAVYFNLTSAAVARRENHALKQQMTGSARPWEILTALAVPNTVVYLLQLVVALGVIAWRMGMPPMTNPVVALVGALLGAVVFSLLAYATSAHTRTAEAAQLTTMPMMLVGLMISGAFVPASILPDTLLTVMQFLPVMPVNELVTIGLGGVTITGEELSLVDTFVQAARPVAVLVGWTVLAGIYVSRRMPIEPRR
jgi:ABC-2 type transport system permease protein